MTPLQDLPIGIQNFEILRNEEMLYVDKTAYLMTLVRRAPRCFLSRPRRFGKSLTLSTIEAMFQGKSELFKGLAAEEWVKKRAEKPVPIIRIDMSQTETTKGLKEFEDSLLRLVRLQAMFNKVSASVTAPTPAGAILETLVFTRQAYGQAAVLIDEYDKPILDNIGDLKKAEEMRVALHSFYTMLKGCDEYIKFLMLTGISKFTKLGVFSGMNNLRDVSMNPDWGAMLGYTQEELENNFSGWIDSAAQRLQMDRAAMLERMKLYYDGFCFDGKTRLYNPFSILNFLGDAAFANYWYDSASPSFIIQYLRQHEMKLPADYRHIQVGIEFVEAQEIENARPESFLYQAGYLTIEKREEGTLTLDFPNEEVTNALAKTYLANIYRLDGFTPLGDRLWKALRDGDLDESMKLYNTGLAGIAGELLGKAKPSEALYNALFLMLLRGAGITCGGEIPSAQGRSDAVIVFPNRAVILEFKLARSENEWDSLLQEGKEQIVQKKYAAPWADGSRAVTAAAVVIDAAARQAVKWG